ncbi:MAG: Gfo/Idh/MocA family oxidoreductase [Pseudomonadota bacterium]
MRVGIIGCGNISESYLRLAPLFNSFQIVACADLDQHLASQRADEFGLSADSVDHLLGRSEIDIVVNLTVPAAHYDVSRAILQAGKHVFSEKPFVLSLQQGRALQTLAKEQGLRIGSAPDTFLGGSHQRARELIDSGAIGRVTSGTGHCMSRGMEHWHPNPDFFFKHGAGPMLDIGPYYVANLVQLLGPVERVMAMSNTAQPQRTILSEARLGETIDVETPTTIHALLTFESGAVVTLGTSWDVQHHTHSNLELYGEYGSLYVPDPNFFGGDLTRADANGLLPTESTSDHPLAVINEWDDDGAPRANYRTVGLADMAASIRAERAHRCSLELALHTIEVLTATLASSEANAPVELTTRCERPAPLSAADAQLLLANSAPT